MDVTFYASIIITPFSPCVPYSIPSVERRINSRKEKKKKKKRKKPPPSSHRPHAASSFFSSSPPFSSPPSSARRVSSCTKLWPHQALVYLKT